jgi:hypothetical protein
MATLSQSAPAAIQWFLARPCHRTATITTSVAAASGRMFSLRLPTTRTMAEESGAMPTAAPILVKSIASPTLSAI